MAMEADVGGWLGLVLDEASTAELDGHAAWLAESGHSPAEVENQRSMAARAVDLLLQRRQRSTELSALNSIASRLSAAPDLGALLQEIVDHARLLLRVDLAYLSLIDGDAMRIEVTSGTVSSAMSGITHPLNVGLVAEAVRRGEPVTTTCYLEDSTFIHDQGADSTMSAEGVRAVIAVPLGTGGRVHGMLFAAEREQRTFGFDATELMVSLAAHAGIAIDNASTSARLRGVNKDLEHRSRELEQILRWDESLTGVVLRGGGVTQLTTEISRIAGTPVSFERAADSRGSRTPHQIVSGGVVLGYLSFDEKAPPDLKLIERAQSALALACMAEDAVREASRRTRDSVLLALLNTGNMDEAEFRQQAWVAGINPEVDYTVVVVEGNHDLVRGRLALGLEEVRWPRGTVIAEYGTRVLVIAPTREPDALVTCWPPSLAGKATAGIGSAVPASRISTSHREAQETLEVMIALGRSGDVGTSADLGLYRILLGGTSESQITKLIDDTLGPLLSEEARRNVPLLQTLSEYLRLNQRRAATAESLNVHVNTLYQRLRAIDRILGPDWRNSDRVIDLQVVLRLRSASNRLALTKHARLPVTN